MKKISYLIVNYVIDSGVIKEIGTYINADAELGVSERLYLHVEFNELNILNHYGRAGWKCFYTKLNHKVEKEGGRSIFEAKFWR